MVLLGGNDMRKKKGLKGMPAHVLERAEKVKSFDIPERLTVTQLAREKEWRTYLKEKAILEIIERSETIGVLVAKDAFESIQLYIQELEKEVEEAAYEKEMLSIKALVDTRTDDEYLEGEELKSAALKIFSQQSKELQNLLDEQADK